MSGSNGTFNFVLIEKVDRFGDRYMFAALKLFNAVLFVRPEPESSDGITRWRCELKPYTPSNQATNAETTTDEAPWIEEHRHKQERKRR